jgi:hypothetical protein
MALDPRRRPPGQTVHPPFYRREPSPSIPVVIQISEPSISRRAACHRCDAPRIVPQFCPDAKEFLKRRAFFRMSAFESRKAGAGEVVSAPLRQPRQFQNRSTSGNCSQQFTSPSFHPASYREPTRAFRESRKTPRRFDAESRRLSRAEFPATGQFRRASYREVRFRRGLAAHLRALLDRLPG